MNQPCLPVPRRRKRTDDGEGKATFDNIESMDAMEYMAAVMQQASAMPEIFTAVQSSTRTAPSAVQTATTTLQHQQRRDHVPIEGSAASIMYLISDRTAVYPPPTERHLPSNCRTWVDGTLANFSSLRLYLEHCRREGVGGKLTERILVPSMKDRSGWHVFCLGQDEARGNVGSYFEDKEDNDDMAMMDPLDSDRESSWSNSVPPRGHDPSIDVVLQMDQVMVRRVLAHMAHYAQHGWAVSVQRTAWLYALLSRLERPIHRDDAATMFGLLKHVTHLRSQVLNPESQRGELARYNVLICILGLYFEQGGGYHNIFTC